MKFEYFVSYSYTTYEQGSGFGSGFYTLDQEIDEFKILNELGEYIKKTLKESDLFHVKGPVVILNFQLIK